MAAMGNAPSGSSSAAHSPFVPLLLALVAVLGWMIFQTTQYVRERNDLARAHLMQDSGLDQAARIRTAADSLVSKTQALADGGDPIAQQIVAQLKQRGVSGKPDFAQAPPQ